jgi:hypothetical protein
MNKIGALANMGLFNFLFNTDTGVESSTNIDTTHAVNCDGTPMIPDSFIDVEGKPFGVCGDDELHNSISDSTDLMSNSFDESFSGFDDSSSSFDDSFSSFDDSSSAFDDW